MDINFVVEKTVKLVKNGSSLSIPIPREIIKTIFNNDKKCIVEIGVNSCEYKNDELVITSIYVRPVNTVLKDLSDKEKNTIKEITNEQIES